MHESSSPLAGKTVTLKDSVVHPQVNLAGREFHVEDWWDVVTGGSWMSANGNPAALIYAMRIADSANDRPLDNEVLYGKVDGLGHLIHVSEIADD